MILVDGSVSERQLKEWIDHSYNLVAGKKFKELLRRISVNFILYSIRSIKILFFCHKYRSDQNFQM